MGPIHPCTQYYIETLTSGDQLPHASALASFGRSWAPVAERLRDVR
jgi:hypothetical protein